MFGARETKTVEFVGELGEFCMFLWLGGGFGFRVMQLPCSLDLGSSGGGVVFSENFLLFFQHV